VSRLVVKELYNNWFHLSPGNMTPWTP